MYLWVNINSTIIKNQFKSEWISNGNWNNKKIMFFMLLKFSRGQQFEIFTPFFLPC